MDTVVQANNENASARNHRLALSMLLNLPDHCALDVGELAKRIGADKLELITWARADLEFARVIASKMTIKSV
jgi:hypothetical protein